MEEDGFVTVSSRKKKGRYAKQNHDNKRYPAQCDVRVDVNKDFVKRRLTECREEFCCGEFYPKVLDVLKSSISKLSHQKGSEPENTSSIQLVCYGIGNFATCLIARYQMALLMALRDDLQISKEDCHFFDPILLNEEKEIIREYDFNIISHNEQGKRIVSKRTLFFMPHCGRTLYNNVLWANWKTHLEHVVIVGNSFNNMKLSMPTKVFEGETKYISSILPFTEEISLPNTFHFKDIFNNTSVHIFPEEKVICVPEEVWLQDSEPEYDCAEAGIIME